ncbi:hypothetical protein FGO68_gene5831 [Halteria grandinella]|uniref:Uncharacterized protein n=1 Tax=Halteria grandinella TaxID=5974 RepID=A0A8J8T1Q4_HALGN|nr:hypothetical protein FGO68_gene5831 [Halteria grandinella]
MVLEQYSNNYLTQTCQFGSLRRPLGVHFLGQGYLYDDSFGEISHNAILQANPLRKNNHLLDRLQMQ